MAPPPSLQLLTYFFIILELPKAGLERRTTWNIGRKREEKEHKVSYRDDKNVPQFLTSKKYDFNPKE